MYLSKNFSSEEFMCNCGCSRSFTEQRLVNALQALRELADKPIKILSGYRCIKHNAEEGGGKNSQHLLGKAADIVIENLTVKEMYGLAEKIEAFKEGGIGIYPDNRFIHVDVRLGPVRWARIKKGKTQVYVSFDEGTKQASYSA